jgi:hypothetical protein
MDKKKMQAELDRQLAKFKENGGEIKVISPEVLAQSFDYKRGKSWLEAHQENPQGNQIKLKKRRELKKSGLKF